MANISIKKDFEDGQKLFAQQLNNNFETIELGINAGNKLIWKDDNGAEFQTFRGTTEEIENRPIIDGQELYNIENGDTFLDVGETRKVMNKPLWKDDNGAQVQSFRGTTAEVAARPIIDGQTLYNIETGETALDVGNNRISTGAGNVVYIGDEEPQNDATKIWIENDQVLNLGSEVAISSEEPTTQEKVWIQRGKNLIDKNLLIFGMELDGNGGTLARSNYYITPFIEIESNTIYTFKGAKSLKGADNYYKDYYDKDYNFISSNEISTFTTPSNAKYVRFNGCSDFTIDLQLEKGEKITPKKIHTKTDNGYEEFYNEEEHSSKILWSNPETTSAFNAQTITLSSDEYDYLEVFYKDYMTNNLVMSERFFKGYGTTINFAGKRVLADKTYVGNFIRNIVYVNDTTFDVSSASYIKDGDTTITTDDRYNIPIYIIGHKL